MDDTPNKGAAMGSVAIAAEAAGRGPLRALTQAVAGRRAALVGILDAARSGDAQAFAALVRRFEKPVYHLVLRMVRQPSVAEDLAQDVFIRLWRHLGGFESAATLPGWLRRVAVNAVIDHWRKEDARRRRIQALREHPLARLALRPSTRMETHEAIDLVQAALEKLPAKLRSVLVLRTAEGMSYEELADVLGTSSSAVRSRLFRARREFEEMLARLKAPEYLARMYRRPRREGRA